MSRNQGGRFITLRLWSAAAILLLAMPTAFLVFYVHILHAPFSAVSSHYFVIGSLAAGLSSVRILLRFIPFSKTARDALGSCLIFCFGLFLITLYAGTIVGLTNWGRVMSVELATGYFMQAPELLKTLNLSLFWLVAFFLIVAMPCILTANLYLRRYDWVDSFFEQISPTISIVASIGLMGIFFASALSLNQRNLGAEAEPLSLSIFPQQAEIKNQSHETDVFRAARLQAIQDEARLTYVARADHNSLHTNVILIVVDALRADHLSLFGYARQTTPNLEKLKNEGIMVVADSAVTACNESFCGLRALASSQYLDQQAEKPFTLHEVLRKHGYKIHLVLSGDHTNFYGIDQIYGKVDSFYDGASQEDRYINDDRLLSDRVNMVPTSDGNPVMFQFHLMSAHALGKRFDETPEFGQGYNYTGMRWGSTNADMPRIAKNYYDRGVLQADAVIARLLAQLKSKGYLDDALVVITGDHGESLGERGLYSHTHSVWEESLRVPMVLLKYGVRDINSKKSNKTISQVDIAPTLLYALDIPRPAVWKGFPIQSPPQQRFIEFQQRQYLGLLDENSTGHIYKHFIDARLGKIQTFDLMFDREEKVDITDQIPLQRRAEWRDYLVRHSGALSRELQDKLAQIPLS